jgi:hypothetical protein
MTAQAAHAVDGAVSCQLSGGLAHGQLATLVRILSELGRSGSVRVNCRWWSGEIGMCDGDVVSATLSSEQGPGALETMLVALSEGSFTFYEHAVACHSEPSLLTRDELPSYITHIAAEHARLERAIPSLTLVPRLAADDQTSRPVIIEREAFLLMPAVVGGRSVEEMAVEHGLARTVYTLAALVEQDIITFRHERVSG